MLRPPSSSGGRWTNVFYTDKSLLVEFKATGLVTARIKGRIFRRSNRDFDGKLERVADDIPVAAGMRFAQFVPSNLAAAVPSADEQTPLRDLIEIVIVPVDDKGVETATPVGRIQLTPRPNLIRITDGRMVELSEEMRHPPVPARFRLFGADPGASISGGNPQFVLQPPIRGPAKPAPQPISVGVYFAPGGVRSPDGAPTESAFQYATHTAIPGQPVLFALHDEQNSPLLVGLEKATQTVTPTDDDGATSTTAWVRGWKSKQEGGLVGEGGPFEDLLANYAKISAIEAAIVGGKDTKKNDRLLDDEQGDDQFPITGFNEREPTAPAEDSVDTLPRGELDAHSGDPQALQRRANTLQATPFDTSYPDADIVLGPDMTDPLASFRSRFQAGRAVFNIIPVPVPDKPVTRPARTIHIAISAHARAELARINQGARAPGGPPFTDQQVRAALKRAAQIVQGIWNDRFGFSVRVEDHPTPQGLPANPAVGVINVLVISARSAVDSKTFIDAAAEQDRITPPSDPSVSHAQQADDYLAAALQLPRPSRTDIRNTPPTTSKGVTPFGGRAKNPLGAEINTFVVRPSGAEGDPRRVACFLVAEGFLHVQDQPVGVRDEQQLAMFIANVIAHEYGHTLGLLEPWTLSPPFFTRQHWHTPYRRNRVSYELYRHQLMIPGPVFPLDVRDKPLDLDAIDRQYLQEVFGAR